MKITIIGGGASGLVCAIKSKNKTNEVTLLERNSKCGKKILITGNGKCNYFNDDFTIKHYYSNDLNLVTPIINENNKKNILMFFDELGVIPKIRDGYYYPYTNQAITIEESLVRKAYDVGVNIETNTLVTDIKYDEKYIINTNKGTIYSDVVVLALGSKAAPQTGSDGMGYELARSLSHIIYKPIPALVQLHVETNKYLKEWSGIRTDVKVTLYENNQFKKSEVGEIQLTDYGISGICVYQLSNIIARGLEENDKEEIVIDFMPWLNIDTKKYLDKRSGLLKNSNISELLDGMLNYKLVNVILKKNKIDSSKKYNMLNEKEKNNLINDLRNFKVLITKTNGYDKAQVCAGGVSLKEIDIYNMKSKIKNNLYIIGELLDVSGDCGGYNLGFAWLSGFLAGYDIKENYD